eukprot:12502791-Ditylum_brightwellii.AAC.1
MEIKQSYPNDMSWQSWWKAMKDKEHLNMFQDGCACDGIPAPSSVPAQVETTNGMVMWEHFMCQGVVGDIDVKQD